MKCQNCGRFMEKVGSEWDDGCAPYVYQDWKCRCGNTSLQIVGDKSITVHGCVMN